MLIESNTNKTQNSRIWHSFSVEEGGLVALARLCSFTDSWTDSCSTESADSWPMCKRLKKLLRWEENSAKTTKITRKVKFFSQNTNIYQVYWENNLERLPAWQWVKNNDILRKTWKYRDRLLLRKTREDSLVAQRFLKPNVSSQINDLHARDDSKPSN